MFALTVVFSPFLSTPSARRATFNRPCHIHLFLISIHALRKEGDGDGRERMISDIEFLSTPSARRATGVVFTEPNHNGDFYPRPPQGGRRGAPPFALSKNYFYPRPPQGGRQGSLIVKGRHADFYPRPPQGGRPLVGRKGALQKTFLSTPSARRATGKLEAMSVDPDNFYPRPPQGGRLVFIEPVDDLLPISIHALRKEGDRPTFCSNWASTRFLSTPSARRATFFGTLPRSSHRHFYPRPPQGGRQATAHGL